MLILIAISRVIEQPFKIPFVASVILAVNTQKPDVVVDVLKRIGSTVGKALDAGVWRDVKLLVRLLGCLQGALEGDGVFTILEELFSRAVDLQTASSEDVSISIEPLLWSLS